MLSELLTKIHHDVVNRINHELTSDEIMFLQDLRDNDPCDLGNLAQIVLVTFSNEEMQELECLTERSMMSARQSHAKESKIQVYPNPTNSGWFVIKSSQPISNSEVFTLYDSSSRVILQATMKEKQQELFMNISDLSSGIYYVQSNLLDGTPIQIVIQ